jgi:prolyl-tRNA editing enzyme YbaK/EbsC (Cys-tRNA(Pro) deacylase)
MAELTPPARRFQGLLDARGVDIAVKEHASSARTAQEAADTLGISVGQIVKSLVFRGEKTGAAYLLLVSGSNRAAEDKAAAILGEPISKADARFVRDVSGFAIGGVPPFGHATRLRTLVDRDLMRFERISASGGSVRATFFLTPAILLAQSGGEVADIAAA